MIQAHEDDEVEDLRSDYRRYVEDIASQINTYRCDPSGEFIPYLWNTYNATRNMDISGGPRICYDDLPELLALKNDGNGASVTKKCKRPGYMPNSIGSLANNFIPNQLGHASRPLINPLKWSEALAYSASMFLKDFEGCNTNPHYIIDKDQDSHYLD